MQLGAAVRCGSQVWRWQNYGTRRQSRAWRYIVGHGGIVSRKEDQKSDLGKLTRGQKGLLSKSVHEQAVFAFSCSKKIKEIDNNKYYVNVKGLANKVLLVF